MSEPQHSTEAAAAYEHLRQTVVEVVADPWAPGAEERLSTAAHAAHAVMYPKTESH
ncbi:hypothetical protein [Streptomyces sp. NRRL F-2747]|uniref:hypothetical protein n=1 Tax=Streptomyces sp. NRRL F-2747 TaxID=1463843 RepID=UPI000B0CC39F|nr:hypothetical protein [Streptomyces sp. NRRL F-2747]